MTNRDILDVALRQQAVDMGCEAGDFLKSEPRVVISRPHPRARRYLKLPFFFDIVSYGNCAVVSADERVTAFAREYVTGCEPYRCFEPPKLHALEREVEKYGQIVLFMAEYFLPDMNRLASGACAFETRLLGPSGIAPLYGLGFHNALSAHAPERDALAVGAYDGNRLVGLAGCSADGADMWQIGVDVLPEYRRRGIGSALTARLAREALSLGKVPFYCRAWANVRSGRNAAAAGFRPAWAEMTAVPKARAVELT